MTCQKCNAAMPADATFCSRCGASSKTQRSLSGGFGKLGSNRPPRSTSGGLPLGLIISWLLLLGGIVMLVPSCLTSDSLADFQPLSGWLMLGCVGSVIAGIVGIRHACPKCRKLFTAQTINSQHLGTHTEIEREHRTAKHTDVFGKPTGTTRYQVDVPVTVTSSIETYQCSRCKHVWRMQQQNHS